MKCQILLELWMVLSDAISLVFRKETELSNLNQYEVRVYLNND